MARRVRSWISTVYFGPICILSAVVWMVSVSPERRQNAGAGWYDINPYHFRRFIGVIRQPARGRCSGLPPHGEILVPGGGPGIIGFVYPVEAHGKTSSL